MLVTSSYMRLCLLLLAICSWHCIVAKPKPPAHSSHEDESEPHSHSKEHEHEHEAHSHSKEHEPHSHSQEDEHEHEPHSHSHSKEHEPHSHSQEDEHEHEPHSHSQEDEHEHEPHSHSKEHEAHSHSKEHEAHSHSKEDSSKEKVSTCTDRKKNGAETDTDCGGKKCPKCVDGKKCTKAGDCISNICKNKLCVQGSTTAKIVTTTTSQPTTTTPQPTTTTTPQPTTTTPEPTTTTPEPTTTTTPQPTTTTPVPTTTTPEPTTTTPEPTTTTPEPTTTTPEPTTTMSPCNPECKNGGTCMGDNVCLCTSDFTGPTCDVQSVGLCVNNETFDSEPILLITFGNGSSQYSNAKPGDWNFNTTYKQQIKPVTNDGMFSFINLIHNDFGVWHTNATDHTQDNGGYMYLVNADLTPGQFYNGRVDNLCVGLRYEFSVYLANLCKPSGRINPNVLFEVRSVDGNILLAQLNSGNIAEQNKLTWEKYGFSFIAPSSSVNLLMISNAKGGNGNDIVIDDIALRVCANKGTGFCPSK